MLVPVIGTAQGQEKKEENAASEEITKIHVDAKTGLVIKTEIEK